MVKILMCLFLDCLGGLLSVVGQNIKLRFESLFDVKIEKVWTKFKTEILLENSVYELSIGDIQSEEQRGTNFPRIFT